MTFFFLSLSVLLAKTDQGLARYLASDGPGGILARRMLPAMILVPMSVGWLRLKGQQAGLYDTEFGLALFATSNILLLGGPHLVDLLQPLAERPIPEEAEAAAQEGREDLAITLDSIGDAVITTDAQGLVVRMNPVAEKLTGWMLAESRGRPLSDVFHILNENTRAPVENPVARVLKEGLVIGLGNHTALVHRDGTERPIMDSGAPIRDVQGVIRGVVMVFRDMTEDRKIEGELFKSESRFAKLAESGIIGIVIVDDKGLLLDANPAFLKIIGYTREGHGGRAHPFFRNHAPRMA